MYTLTEKHVCFHVIYLTFDPTGKGSIPIHGDSTKLMENDVIFSNKKQHWLSCDNKIYSTRYEDSYKEQTLDTAHVLNGMTRLQCVWLRIPFLHNPPQLAECSIYTCIRHWYPAHHIHAGRLEQRCIHYLYFNLWKHSTVDGGLCTHIVMPF